MRLRRQKRPQRESLVARDARERKLRRDTQGHDRYEVRTVGPGSLKGVDALYEGKWLWAGNSLIGVVKTIRPVTRPLPFPDQVVPRVPSYFQVFIEKPWEYADLPRQYIDINMREIRPFVRAGITQLGNPVA